MPPSYRKINYSLRAGKSIERKMICDAVRKLSVFNKIDDYCYCGFGSTFFTDFILFHRSLGINKMINIEKDEFNEDRFNFNVPFSCIETRFGDSNDILPELPWDKPIILWLDYDDPLDVNMLSDVATFFTNATNGSMFIISVNAEVIKGEGLAPDKLFEHRLDDLEKRITKLKMPPGLTAQNLTGANLTKTYRNIINDEIQEALSNRNGANQVSGQQWTFAQVLNFIYKDNAQMYTIGGVLYNNESHPTFQKARFEDLPFFSKEDQSFSIEIPSLTIKEIKFIESLLPNHINPNNGKISGVTLPINPKLPENDVLKYSKIYRYFPHFTEAIL